MDEGSIKRPQETIQPDNKNEIKHKFSSTIEDVIAQNSVYKWIPIGACTVIGLPGILISNFSVIQFHHQIAVTFVSIIFIFLLFKHQTNKKILISMSILSGTFWSSWIGTLGIYEMHPNLLGLINLLMATSLVLAFFSLELKDQTNKWILIGANILVGIIGPVLLIMRTELGIILFSVLVTSAFFFFVFKNKTNKWIIVGMSILIGFSFISIFMILIALILPSYWSSTIYNLRVPVAIAFSANLFFVLNNRVDKLKPFNPTLEDNKNDSNSSDLNGYTIISIPEDKKSLFHELLKGFEEYANIKGYQVNISVNSSIDGKIAFRFTLQNHDPSTKNININKDFNEYFDKILNSEELDHLPMIIDPINHKRFIMALKSKLTYLKYYYELEKTLKELYKESLNSLRKSFLESHKYTTATPTIQIHNQGDIKMDYKNYIANNSVNVAQGDNHSNVMNAKEINIGSSLDERIELTQKIEVLISLLSGTTNGNQNIYKAKRYLESAKDELEDESEPDKNLILKWLGKAKSFLETLELDDQVISKAKEIFQLVEIT